MKKIVHRGFCLLVLGACLRTALGQAIKDPKEYDAYMVVFNEKTDFAKKADLAEKFLASYAKSDARPQAYLMMITSYYQAGKFDKALEAADRLDEFTSRLDESQKMQVVLIGMTAAGQVKNNVKTVNYARKVLNSDPNNVNALITLSAVLSQTLPQQEQAKQAQIVETLEITLRALAQPKPDGVADAQWDSAKGSLHQTACLMLLNQQKYDASIEECRVSLQSGNKDGYPWYLIGLSHKVRLLDLVKRYNEAVNNYNDRRTTVDQITLDDLIAIKDGAEKLASDKKDETLDAFARAVAAGGPAAAEARKELQQLFTGTPEELNRMIEERKSQTRG
jgi:tetratricopeptide (TPR) repeat protein